MPHCEECNPVIQLLIEAASEMLRTARMLDLLGYENHHQRAGCDDKANRIVAWLKEHGNEDSKAFIDDMEQRSTLHAPE